jgi:predicted dehydrogenase
MRIHFGGQCVDEPQVRVGHIGCGSHSFRNIFPTYQFAPVDLVATCDLDLAKAQVYADQFGADRAYSDYGEMIEAEELDAVVMVTGYDERGRPTYPTIARDCLEAGCHVWMEKPPAATSAELEQLQGIVHRTGLKVMVGLKKMFFPANEKAKALMTHPHFGQPALALLQYPQYIPTSEEFDRYLSGQDVPHCQSFLDHLCHPVSLLLYLLGMPDRLFYTRSGSGAGVATLSYNARDDREAMAASLALTHGASRNGGMERTMLVGTDGAHILVENCLRVSFHRTPSDAPGTGYGRSPDFYTGTTDETTATWMPEFSLGQLYNKGLFLLGYYNEINVFARAVLDGSPLPKADLTHAWQATRIFEAFAQGPDQVIVL